MSRFVATLFAVVMLFGAHAHALTVAEVVVLTERGSSPQGIIRRIEASRTMFVLTVSDMDALRAAGVDAEVIGFMRRTPGLFGDPDESPQVVVDTEAELAREPLTLARVVHLSVIGVADRAIREEITRQKVVFSVSAGEAGELRRKGLSTDLIAFLASTAPRPVVAPPVAAPPRQIPPAAEGMSRERVAAILLALEDNESSQLQVTEALDSYRTRRYWALALGIGAGGAFVAALAQTGLNVSEKKDLKKQCDDLAESAEAAGFDAAPCGLEVDRTGEGVTYGIAGALAIATLAVYPWSADPDGDEDRLKKLRDEERGLRGQLLGASLDISPFGAGLIATLRL